MTRSIPYFLLAALGLTLLSRNVDAGPILEPDTTDQMVTQSGLNNGYYDSLYTIMVGRAHQQDNADLVDGYALPYLAPGQTVTGATVTYWVDSINGTPAANVQLYGLNRVNTTSSAPIPTDFYLGANDTANTLLDAKFITPQTAAKSTVTYSGSNLTSFIQKQYTNAAFSGLDLAPNRYIFLRLSPDATGADWNNYVIGGSRNPIRSKHPTLAISISNGIANVAGRLQFSFSLPQASITSAGVYNPSTGALIRTLWNSVQYQTGMNYGVWDGKDDSGATVASGTAYQIKMIYHNVTYVWDGTIGNTSANQTGPNTYHSNGPVRVMAAGAGYMYYATGYDELFNPYNKFAIGTPQLSYQANSNFIQDPYSHTPFVAADATHNYWAKCAGGLAGWVNTYIFAFNNADGAEYTFPKGTTPGGANQKYTSAVDYDSSATPSSATGLAVQQSGNALFVSHGDKNVVRVFDKLQGSSLGTFTVANAGQMAVTANGDVWVISNATPPTISRYTFASGKATLKATVTSVVAPVGLGVSSDDSLLLVTDGGSSQQVKAFDNDTGAASWTYGLAGGMYTNGPNVVNNCFDFGAQSYIAYQPDGTFWVGDSGNYRQMHFSNNNGTLTYIDQIGYIPLSYSVCVDTNAPTRVFNRFIEHSVNYSLPLGGTNGSWKVVRNWAYGLPDDTTHHYFGFQDGISSAQTLSNGRTYGLVKNYKTLLYDLFELPPTGMARATGYSFDNSPRIYEDGTLRFNVNTHGTSMNFYSMPLTGFDAYNNPKWGSPTLLASTAIASTDPQSWTGCYNERTEITSGGMVIDYDPSQYRSGYHLGAIAQGGTSFKWRTARSTSSTYKGWFPQDGTFDIANGTGYAGDMDMAMGANVVCGYHGEFWKNGEASQYNDFYENGLLVGHFGTFANASMNTRSNVDGFAGNSYSPQLVKVNGQVYLYSNDESNHGGTIRWKINGWDGIANLSATGSVGGTASLSGGAGAPTVSLTSPSANSNYFNGRSVTLSAQASSTSGTGIASVEFFDGSTSLGSATAVPYLVNYPGLGTGSHVITAKATDANGKSTTSAAVNITVGSEGTSTPPPAPTSLAANGASGVALSWTQPNISTTSSSNGQSLSFQFQSATDANALLPTDVAGAPGYTVAHFNLLSRTGTGTSNLVFTNPINSSGVTIPNLAMNLQIVLSNDNGSTAKFTGTTLKLFSGETSTAFTTSVGISIFNVPYGIYDLVVYSQPGNISTGTKTSSITVNDNMYSTTVNQTFTAMQTGCTIGAIGFGSSTSVTNCNTIVVRGLTASSFKLLGNNIAGFQIVQRPYDQGIPSSYSIERATGTSGAFAQIGTASGTALSYTDATAAAGTTYQYRIQALNTYGSSPFSNTVTVTVSGTATAGGGTTSGGTTSGGTTSGGTTSGGTTSGGTTSGGTTSGGTTSGGTTSGGTTSGGTTSGGTTSGGTTSGGTTSGGATTTAQTGFQKWQAKYFTTAQLADATVSGADADPYGSGVPNLLAYALQLNPATARPTDVPHAENVNGRLTMSYFVPTANTDITYLVQVSTDLITWKSGAGYTLLTSTSSSAGKTYTAVDQYPVSYQKHFMRLLVTQN